MKRRWKLVIAKLVVLMLISTGIALLGTHGSIGVCRHDYPQLEVENRQVRDYFPADYPSARGRFLDSLRKRGVEAVQFQHSQFGPDGGPLATDVAVLGPTDASATLVISSGTHGVEGFAGSGIQYGLLQEDIDASLPEGVKVILIHALNPFGMAHLRRFTGENVDLNRNFPADWDNLPDNAGYPALADALSPVSVSFWSEVSSWFNISWYRLVEGDEATRVAITSGQYTHPRGLFYGGTGEVAEHRTIQAIADRYLPKSAPIVWIDIHTGLGTFGSAEIILNNAPDSEAYRRAVEIWGPESVKATPSGDSVSVHLEGTLKLGVTRIRPEATVIGLEFGTLPPEKVFKALRAESWLHHYGGKDHPQAPAIKEALLHAFYPDSDGWKGAVWTKGREVVLQALAWLSRGGGSP